MFYETLQPEICCPVKQKAKTLDNILSGCPCIWVRQMTQVGRQHEQTFHKGNCQCSGNHQGKGHHQSAQRASDKKQGNKRHNGGGHGSNYGHTNLKDALYSCLQRRVSLFASIVDCLTHHNCIIHNNAQHGDHPEESHHVNSSAVIPHDHEGAHDAHRHPHTRPETQAYIKKQPKQHKY